MRLSVLAAAAALLLGPTSAGAQTGDAGPDSGMNAQTRAEASGARAEACHRDAPAQAERTAGAGGGDGAKSDTECDAKPGESGGGTAGDSRADRARCRKLTDADIVTAPIGEVRVVSHHQATIGGRPVSYAATAGTLTLRDDEGKPTASMFYVAYATGDARRPVTFLYNGGPGSSTLWLHMGSVGPVRVLTDSPASTHNAPYELTNNADSLLDKSDLVFLDAVGAGFSRPLGDTKLAAFWGADQDIDAFARGVERWLTINQRWNAPKFLFGESYGTTRSAGLSYRLQSDGVQLNGVVLLSSILNYGRRQPGFDQEMINYLPSYAAAAAYHHKLAATPTDLRAFLAEVREFARGPYALALAKGQDLGEAERRAVAEHLAGYIGLPVDVVLAADLRISAGRFRKELLRGERLTLGRYDDRFTGEDFDAAGETPEFDPSNTGMTGAYVAAFHDYLTRELGYASDLAYRPTFYGSGLTWDFNHKAAGLGGGGGSNQADVALDLSQAMRENPHMLLFSLNGLYDLATPFFGTEYDLGHMQLDPALRGNVRFAYYPSGHMVYLNPDALHAMKGDLAKFYDEAAPGRWRATAPQRLNPLAATCNPSRMPSSPAAEAARRRTFAIISHPDAGKTTLTEHLLLAGGAIRAAGAVRARGEQRRTRSDWMKIERERGISVSASAMTFDHAGLMFNLLDTPGHEDFSEDTYRTLTAADAAVMVLDAAKGIEPQTLKLFEVCRLRDIPIVTFINKMDREAQDPFALLDEIASKLALDPAPLYWPAGSGNRFKGVMDLRAERFLPYERGAATAPAPVPIRSNAIVQYLDPDEQGEVEEGAMLVQEAAKPFDPESFLEGHMTPVFFGSALRHFGVEELLAGLGAYAPPPKPVAARRGGHETHVAPGDPEVSGFVFKVQANIDPGHRDRIAFLRLTSGRFSRGMKLKVESTHRQISVNSPVLFFASERELAEEAYAGDVIGIPNHGVLRVGDSLSESGALRFAGLPNFAPEILQRVRVKDPLKAKHLKRALEGLAEEGVTQLFRPIIGADFIVGAVGPLQFEVMADRLAGEFGLDVAFEAAPYAEARWLAGERADLEDFAGKHRTAMAEDIDEAPVFLAKSSWEVGYVTERFPKVAFERSKERA